MWVAVRLITACDCQIDLLFTMSNNDVSPDRHAILEKRNLNE
jgi:hypothetical protein